MAKRTEQKGFDLDSAAVANQLREAIGKTFTGWLDSANTVDPEVEAKKKQLESLLSGDALKTALASLPDSTDNVDDAKETIAKGIVTLCNELGLPVAFKDLAEQQKKLDDIGRKVLVALKSGGVDLDSLSVSASETVRHVPVQKDDADKPQRAKRGSMPKEADAETIALIKKTVANGQAWSKKAAKAAMDKAGIDTEEPVMKKKIDLAFAQMVTDGLLLTDGKKAGMTYTKAWKGS